MSVGVLVPDGNVSIIVVVSTMLMEDEVGVNAGLDVVGSIRTVGESPLEIGLVTVGVLIPDGNWGVITGNSSLQVGNSVWAEG